MRARRRPLQNDDAAWEPRTNVGGCLMHDDAEPNTDYGTPSVSSSQHDAIIIPTPNDEDNVTITDQSTPVSKDSGNGTS